MDTILVTGGSGFIGSNLVKRLIVDGYNVRVFDNNFRGSKEKLGRFIKEVDFIEGDIRDSAKVNQACKRVQSLFHLAFINGTRYFYEMPAQVLEVGVKGAINTLDAALKNGVHQYILASSSEVYQEPTTIPTPETERLIIPDVTNPRYSYAGGKIISELLTLHYDSQNILKTLIFRPHNIYGPDMGSEHVIPEFIIRMKRMSGGKKHLCIDFPIEGSGMETRAFCYIDDFVDGLMTMFKSGNPGEIFHIGNDQEEISIRNLACEIAKIMDIQLNMVSIEIKKGGTSRRCPDLRKIRNLGFEPRVCLEEGLVKTVDWYVNRI